MIKYKNIIEIERSLQMNDAMLFKFLLAENGLTLELNDVSFDITSYILLKDKNNNPYVFIDYLYKENYIEDRLNL